MSDLKQSLKDYGFSTRKSWGQNFIFDKNILRKIAGDSSGVCMEIGPGPGGLTRELLNACDKVIAIEIDPKLYEFLENSLEDYDNLCLINKDFLEINLDKLYKEEINQDFIVVANLPYYITTPVMMKILDSNLPVKSMRVMVQKEVAKRIIASPANKDYGVLSLMVQCRGDAKIAFDVPPHVFSPAPTVTSSLVDIDLSGGLKIKSTVDDFRKCVRSGFSSRRKQIANNLSSSYSISKDDVYEILQNIGLNKDVRAEKLSVSEFDSLCIAIKEHKQKK